MKRPVRTLIQVVAIATLLFGVLEIGLEIAHHQVQVREHVDPIKTNYWSYVIGGALLPVGFILFAGANSLAEQLTDDIDDGDDSDGIDDVDASGG